jgi:hypothetical protein
MAGAKAAPPVPAPALETATPKDVPIISSYVVERQSGVVQSSWQRVKAAFRKLFHG